MANSKSGNATEKSASAYVSDDMIGKAYQSIAQSTAIAIQDATDNLRNINTISATALGVAMAQMLENPSQSEAYKEVISRAKAISDEALNNFKAIGEQAAAILKEFPKNG